MKHLLSMALLSLCVFFPNVINAEPADSRPVTITQADGSKLTVISYGDEFFNYVTTLSGDPIAYKDGFFYYVNYDRNGEMEFSNQKVSQQKTASGERAYLSRRQTQNMSQIASVAATRRRKEMFPEEMQKMGFPTEGVVRAIVILAEFQDVRFQPENSRQKFNDRLNQVGYSGYPSYIPGATGDVKGSARDYFLKASGGKFTGQFDVVGPYTLANNMAYYGENMANGSDIRPREMVKEAADMAHARGVDFSQYDHDQDGYIDNVFVYYAGYSESNNSETMPNTIWPHKWSAKWLEGGPYSYNNKILHVYACAGELRDDNVMAGIGTFVHEFGHVFGLADHYDTDQVNGRSQGLGKYDIMTSGSHNNNGYTPPMYTALEMMQCGWLTPITIRNNLGGYALPTIDNQVAYGITTEVQGEYFLIENRQKNDPNNHWDNFIPGSGMLITHVDRSANSLDDWTSNGPNNNTARERYRIVHAQSGDISYSWSPGWANLVFPSGGNTEFNKNSSPRAQSWAGNLLQYGISNISESKSIMKFTGENFVKPENLVISQTELFLPKGQEIQLAATVFPSGVDQAIAWSSSDNTVASVDATGSITAIKSGTVTISAKDCWTETCASQCEVTVETVKFTVSAWQVDARIDWESMGYDDFKVVLKVAGGESKIFQVDTSMCQFADLDPATTYNVAISVAFDAKQELELLSTELTTIAKVVDVPLICLSEYEYAKDTPIFLKAINLFEGDKVSWKVDEKTVSEGLITLKAGEHTIKAVVRRGEIEYVAIKTILIK